MWPLIVLASVLLVLSIFANWIQAEALDTDWVVSATDEMLVVVGVALALVAAAPARLAASLYEGATEVGVVLDLARHASSCQSSLR